MNNPVKFSMSLSRLVAASTLAINTGVKAIGYGPPGSGKTPLVKTAPRPVIGVIEPGTMSLRDATNIPAFVADTPAKALDFLRWWHESGETGQFDTLFLDSATHFAEIVLREELKKTKHGMKAYGEMAQIVYNELEKLYKQPNKHVFVVAKQGTIEENGVQKRRPYFPGQDLSIRVPHLFDGVFHLGLQNVPGQPGPVRAIRTREAFDCVARDRSGRLDEFERPDLSAIFSKMMS